MPPNPVARVQIDTIILYYYFHIKKVHFEMFKDKIMSENSSNCATF